MKQNNVRLRWARKILRAKNFVVLTDTDSVIALRGVDPSQLDDITTLHEQSASIDSFMYMLQDLKEEHQRAIEKIMDSRTEATKAKGKKV